LWKCLEASFQDEFKRRSRHLSTSIRPALEDLPVELLYLTKAYKDVLWGCSVREGLMTTFVNERDGEVLDALQATIIVDGGQAGDIEQANPARSSKLFFVARAWRCDAPPPRCARQNHPLDYQYGSEYGT